MVCERKGGAVVRDFCRDVGVHLLHLVSHRSELLDSSYYI